MEPFDSDEFTIAKKLGAGSQGLVFKVRECKSNFSLAEGSEKKAIKILNTNYPSQALRD